MESLQKILLVFSCFSCYASSAATWPVVRGRAPRELTAARASPARRKHAVGSLGDKVGTWQETFLQTASGKYCPLSNIIFKQCSELFPNLK